MLVEIKIDPHKQYTHVSEPAILQATGALALWCHIALVEYGTKLGSQQVLGDLIEERYDYKNGWYVVCHVSPEGISSYPGDPKVYPAIEMSLTDPPEVKIWLMPQAVVYYTVDNGVNIYSQRMD